MPASAYKCCTTCGQEKPVSEFHRTRNRNGSLRLTSSCKPCACERSRQWHRDNRARFREGRVQRKFGISIAEYEALMSRHCAICGVSPDKARMHLDHDHKTGKVREALCSNCNGMLGFGRDDPERFRAAAVYLQKHRTP